MFPLFKNKVAPVYGIDDHHNNVVFAPHWYDLNCVFYKKFMGTLTHDVQHLQKVRHMMFSLETQFFTY
jgi:hypothetical protein